MYDTTSGWGAIILASVITLFASKLGMNDWALVFVFFATALGIVMVKVGEK